MSRLLPVPSACKIAYALSGLFIITSVTLAQGTGYWHTSGNQIVDVNNTPVRIAGLNWYGFETTRAIPGGLTSQDYKTILQTIKKEGYNTIRVPLSNQMIESPPFPTSISYSNSSGAINTDLQGLNSLSILDKIVAYAGTIGLKIILDNHRSEAGDSAESSGLWFTGYIPSLLGSMTGERSLHAMRIIPRSSASICATNPTTQTPAELAGIVEAQTIGT